MPIGKIGETAGKGADYKAGSVNLDAATANSGGKVVSGYQKTSATHSYGAGALNIEASTNVPKVKENLGVAKTELAGTSQYGAGAVLVEGAINAPKIKHEALGQVDKTK
ncbi:hypothetical protein EMCRGX_G023804 [Ephydatia muelleri]|eukprot:Em0015g51a